MKIVIVDNDRKSQQKLEKKLSNCKKKIDIIGCADTIIKA